MGYEKQTWIDGEIITKEKLNHIEEGIAKIELTPGPQGEPGQNGATGSRGSRIWTSDKITGQSTQGTVFSNSGISGALVYDYCINKNTGDLYVCSKGGEADVAEWKYDSNIKGPKGDKGNTGAAGADAVINKLDKIDSLESEAVVGTVVTVLNSLIADLKEKGLMNN
jgi:hypothetical protein